MSQSEGALELANDPIAAQLSAQETIRTLVDSIDGRVVVNDKRLAVTEAQRIALNVEMQRIRRVQFDIERQRPATDAGAALAYVGRTIHDITASS